MILIDDIVYYVFYKEEEHSFSVDLLHVLAIQIEPALDDSGQVNYIYTGQGIGSEEKKSVNTATHSCFSSCEEALEHILTLLGAKPDGIPTH